MTIVETHMAVELAETGIESEIATFVASLDTDSKVGFLSLAQLMISDALDIAENLLPIIRNVDDELFVVVLDECDQRVEALCDGPFSDWRMARTALARITEGLNQQDPELLVALLDHTKGYASKV